MIFNDLKSNGVALLLEREKIAVHGIVQGVGFRPFIHKLVQEYGLRGFIKNTSSGVELELEGERETLERFTACISAGEGAAAAELLRTGIQRFCGYVE